MTTKGKIVLDATPLIHLTRAGLLPLLRYLPHAMLVPPEVVAEVVHRGKEQGHPDAALIGQAISDGLLIVKKPADQRFVQLVTAIGRGRIHPADAEVLALAREEEGVAVLDDRAARDVARAHGIRVGGTAFLLAMLIGSGRITREEAWRALDEMIGQGWRCSAELYSRIIRMIQEG